jgi:alpha-1,3-mannosyltransferase
MDPEAGHVKIIHIVRQFYPSVGGLESAVLSLARVQRERYGIDARVVTLNRLFGQREILPSTDLVAGVPVTRLAWRGSPRYPLAFSVLAHLQSADVVHVHAIDFFFDFLALTRPWHRRKMVASTHGGFFHTSRWAAVKKLWFATVTRISSLAYHRIIACSHSDAALFSKHAGRLAVIENGIDPEKFAGAAARHGTRTIIYFGRFAHHKRIASLFPILAELIALHPGWRLIVAGGDADQTVAELMAKAAEANVTEAVRFMANPTDTELTKLIGEASYFACLSSHEGFGLAAVEAMSAGLMPVLSDIPPFKRLLQNRHVGLLVNPDDPVETALAIESSVAPGQEAYQWRQAQLADAVRGYDWEQVAAQYIEIYEAAMRTKSASPVAARLGPIA